jgi:hypothetical protein
MKIFFLILTIAAVNGGIMKLTPGTHVIKLNETVSIEAKKITLQRKMGINISELTEMIRNSISKFFDFCQKEEIATVQTIATYCNASAVNIQRYGEMVIENISKYGVVQGNREKRNAALDAFKSFFTKSIPAVLFSGISGLTHQINRLKETIAAIGNDAKKLNLNMEINRYSKDVFMMLSSISMQIENFVTNLPLPLEEIQELVRGQNQTGEYAVPEMADFGESKVFYNNGELFVFIATVLVYYLLFLASQS